jgi:hypothetical protein
MRRVTLGLLLSVAGFGLAHAADEAPVAVDGRTYARHLASVARAAHPGVRAVVVRTAGAPGTPGVLVGASPTGAVKGVVAQETLKNVSGDPLGTIDITFAPNAHDRATAAAAIGRYVSKRALSAKNLSDPYPYDPGRRADTYAQALVDRTMRAHPELLVFAIHATPPGETTNIIIGSNIGRIGKKADEDDLRVIEKGATNLEVAEGGERFEVELPLNDAAGRRIGALGTVFAYKAGDDKKALEARAIAIRDALARQIPTSAALFKTHG